MEEFTGALYLSLHNSNGYEDEAENLRWKIFFFQY